MKVKPADRTASVQEYYFSRKLSQIEMMRRSGTDVINLGIGSPDQPPSENTIRRLSEEAARPGVHGYQSYNGNAILRKAFVDWYLKYFRVSLNPDNEILPLMGSKEGIMHISLAFVNEGDEVLVPDPGYPTYSSVTSLVGGKIKYYPLEERNGWHPDLELLEKEDLGKVKLMWVNYPNMPTGARGSLELFRKLVSFAARHNILLCNDNPYSFILSNEYLSLLSTEGAMETALELNSLSKSHNMAGWRLGMVAGNPEYIKNILKVKSNMDSGMFLPMQLAAAEALNNPPSWYDEINSIYRQRRIIAESLMDLLQCRFDKSQSGLFLWGRLPDTIGSCEAYVEEILGRAHVFITPGFIFGPGGDRYIRISLCATEERLIEARSRINEVLNQSSITNHHT
ncbi:MAG: aminotransferase class I/II-fold pyridoxal phosphate-dependent enzyme [Bacteroidales bacterium]